MGVRVQRPSVYEEESEHKHPWSALGFRGRGFRRSLPCAVRGVTLLEHCTTCVGFGLAGVPRFQPPQALLTLGVTLGSRNT